ncbi:hypothetical protein GG344DRAFT_83402, partial [Lentinula edodes]
DDTDDEKPGFGFGLKVSTSSLSPTATITSSARTTLFVAFSGTSLPFAAVGGTTSISSTSSSYVEIPPPAKQQDGEEKVLDVDDELGGHIEQHGHHDDDGAGDFLSESMVIRLSLAKKIFPARTSRLRRRVQQPPLQAPSSHPPPFTLRHLPLPSLLRSASLKKSRKNAASTRRKRTTRIAPCAPPATGSPESAQSKEHLSAECPSTPDLLSHRHCRRQEGDDSSARIARAHSHPESHWHRSPLAHCDPRLGPAPYANHSHLLQLLRPASLHLGWGDSELMVADLQKTMSLVMLARVRATLLLLAASKVLDTPNRVQPHPIRPSKKRSFAVSSSHMVSIQPKPAGLGPHFDMKMPRKVPPPPTLPHPLSRDSESNSPDLFDAPPVGNDKARAIYLSQYSDELPTCLSMTTLSKNS